jgi:catechol 2,3-dioxygenase
MATEPLDANEVMQSGGGRDWDGAPAGTVVGHVHLFVSDLQRAEHFYHLGMGFDKIVWSYHGALFMSAGGYHHHLGTNTWARGAMIPLLLRPASRTADSAPVMMVRRAGWQPIRGVYR